MEIQRASSNYKFMPENNKDSFSDYNKRLLQKSFKSDFNWKDKGSKSPKNDKSMQPENNQIFNLAEIKNNQRYDS